LPNYRNVFDDPGQFALTLDDGDLGTFNTPSLREVSRTAPYMHNGSLATLHDVVWFYNDGGGPAGTAGLPPLGLSDTEIDQLVAFLETLSSRSVDVVAPNLPDYSLVPLGGGQGE
jgi:cytochrome c peroxidase